MAEVRFDFETRIERRGSSSIKWDWDERRTGRKGLLPFWVADMDFRAAPPVLKALERRVEHGIFGYTARPESLDEALVGWLAERHGWHARREDILEVPGIVPFLHMYVGRFTAPGDAVVIQEPVYYPFRKAIERNGRRVAENPLIRGDDGRWRMDLEGLERTIRKSGAATLILCSPHNPVGRVWKLEELRGLAAVCRESGVTVVSDEIHADLVHSPHVQVPWLTLPPEARPRSVALVSATKTFNLPGLTTAFAVTDDSDFRREIGDMLTSLGMGEGSSSPLSYIAAEAAWREGGPWLEALLIHLSENDVFLREVLGRGIPGVGIAPLEGTYLEWLDLGAVGLDGERAYDRLLDAGVWLSRGTQFGRGGEGHVRMNIACPRSQLEEGLGAVIRALKG